MGEKIEARREQQYRFLTASEIRVRVEEIAEQLAVKMRATPQEPAVAEMEAYPLDTRKFIMLMADFVRMN